MTWLQRIEAALQTGEFTQDDKEKAGEWNTCAVGEHLYPVHGDHRKWHFPKGVNMLGLDFVDAVYDDHPDVAMLLWKEIQEEIRK